MTAERHELTELAASVADGAPVDWQNAEGAAEDPRDRRLVQHLRLVSSVAELYRSLPADGPGEEPVEGGAFRWGHLVVGESIGRGTSADVYRAWDVDLQRDVALKLFPADSGAAPRRHAYVLSEARRLARVRHPNVAAVYGADRDGDRVGFWMEFVRGTSLQDLLDRDGPFGAREVALIGSELCAALAAVHGAGLLHRDIKAQNVLREHGGRIVLTDFGTGDEVGALSRGMAGTPMYLAPEVLRGGDASVASDLYSLGVLLFLLASGRFPIAASGMQDLVRAHAEGRRQRLRDLRPDFPAELAGVIETALSPDPSARYESAGAFDEALRRTIERRPASPGREARASRGRWLRSVVVLTTLAAVVALIVWAGWRHRTATATNARIDSIAVLPIADLSGQAPQLADAMTDQLITALGHLHALRVTSRTSVLRFRGNNHSATDVGQSLGVRAVLEASLALGDASSDAPRPVRVNARLLDTDTGAQIWGGTFRGVLGETLALQASIARAIAESVQAEVSAAEATQLDRPQQTSPAAEQAYFQGRLFLNDVSTENWGRAAAAFERASQLDPRFAPAFAGLARADIALGFAGVLSQPEARARALAAATHALELNPDLADAATALADLQFYYDWNWKGADQSYRRAIDLRPSGAYIRTQYARYLAAAGRLPEAVDQARQATAVDPLSALAAQTEGLIQYYARDYASAEAALQRALQIDSRFAPAEWTLGRVYDAQGRIVEARDAVEKAVSMSRSAPVSWRAHLVRLQALGGRVDEARAALRAIQIAAPAPRSEHLAYIYVAFGDSDRALTLLERAANERDPALLWLGVDPRVDPLRGTPRFDALLARLRRPE